MDQPEGKVVGIIRDAAGERAIIDVDAASACPRCAKGRGCGAGLLQGSGRTRRVEALIDAGSTIREGDTVRLVLSGGSILAASLIAYGLPLAGAAAAAVIAHLLRLPDSGALMLAVAGLVVGFMLGRRRLRRRNCLADFTPTAVGRLPAAH